jgi:tetratricopeptide (TPR) repeat protein
MRNRLQTPFYRTLTFQAGEARQNLLPAMADESAQLPPRYREPRRIGHGGMGNIYRARDSMLERDVAIKVLSERYAQDEANRERFTREALASARLSSDPAIVTIFDVGEWNGRPFIVMEYLGGGSLEDRLRDGRPATSQALVWLEQAARALDTAHEQGIVHRDVKPGNLLLDDAGEVNVADFGIASAAGMDSLTVAGTILGTAGYLSPEQAHGERATPASDRYALAVVAFELLTGRRPFARESPTAEAAAHANDPIPSVAQHAPDLPAAELDRVFRRALAKDPADRYPTAVEFVNDLRSALAAAETRTQVLAPAPIPPAAGTPPPPPGRRGPSTRTLALAGLLLAALGGGAALAAALATDDDAGEPPRAQVRTVERTITQQGETQTQTVTTTAPPPPTTAPTTGDEDDGEGGGGGQGGGSYDEGVALTDQATSLMNQGRYEEAIDPARRAVDILEGTMSSSRPYEAYANYNLGRSLIETGDCDGGLPYLDRSQQLQGERSEITAARAQCS